MRKPNAHSFPSWNVGGAFCGRLLRKWCKRVNSAHKIVRKAKILRRWPAIFGRVLTSKLFRILSLITLHDSNFFSVLANNGCWKSRKYFTNGLPISRYCRKKNIKRLWFSSQMVSFLSFGNANFWYAIRSPFQWSRRLENSWKFVNKS